MSLFKDLSKINPKQFEAIAREIAGEIDYSDHDLATKCAANRKKYPLYEYICSLIENNGEPLLEETLIHAIGMEQMLRTLIVIGEKNAPKRKK